MSIAFTEQTTDMDAINAATNQIDKNKEVSVLLVKFLSSLAHTLKNDFLDLIKVASALEVK